MRLLSYALSNISRNRWLSFSSTLVLALLIFFVNVFFFLFHGTEYFISTINDRISISLNLKDGYTADNIRVNNLVKDISLSVSWAKIDYISASGALEIFRERDPELAKLIEDESENPLPNTLQIQNIEINQYETLNTIIASYQDTIEYDKENFDRKLLSYKSQYTRIYAIVSFLQSVQFAILVLVILFCFTVWVIMYLIIGNFIFFHRDEIKIIELVGGGNSFLYGPFVLQATIYALWATLIALLSVYFLLSLRFLEKIFLEQNLDVFIDSFLFRLTSFSLIEVLIFCFIGAISGYIAARKYTQKIAS